MTGDAISSEGAVRKRENKPFSMADLGYLYQFRLILIGDSTVGKSSLLRQFKEGEYFADISLTVGVDFHAKVVHVNRQPIKLQLWDTAGQDRFRAIVRAYYRNAVGGLLVFDISHRESFTNLPEWLEDAKKNADPHHLVFILVGNKNDQEKRREVSKEEAVRYAREHDMPYIETSAKSGANVEEAFVQIARKIYRMIEDGHIQVQDGWDGVKRGEASRQRSVSPLRESNYTASSVSFEGNVLKRRSSEQGSSGKCC